MRAAQGVIRTPRVPNSDCLSRSPSQCFLYPRFKLDGTWAASARAAQVCRQQEQQHLIARTPRLHSTRFQQISLPVESIFSDAPPTLPSPSKQLVDNIDDDPFLFLLLHPLSPCSWENTSTQRMMWECSSHYRTIFAHV